MEQHRLLVVGGGTAGNALASRFSRYLPKGQVAVVDGDPKHYYQPGFTLLGGGLAPPAALVKNREKCLPKSVKLYQVDAGEFNPAKNSVTLKDGTEIGYEFLVVSTGLDLRFDLVEGLTDALNEENNGVCSIYRFDLAQKTYLELQRFQGGTAVFTYPNTPIKCPGAPQKIAYLADEIFRQNNVRDKTKIIFNNTLGVIFPVPKYADELMKVINSRGIELNTRDNLIKVDTKNRVATFQVIDSNQKPTDKLKEIKYDLLHVGPPCSGVESLRNAFKNGDNFTDSNGWVTVEEKTLQSKIYKNVFAFGDRAGTTNKKTAAAVADQLRVLTPNLKAVMEGKPLPNDEYAGYASCPTCHRFETSEFNHEGPIETMPLNQARPSFLNYWVTRYFVVWLYWNVHVKGFWSGPSKIRKVLHLGFDKQSKQK
ncbi:Sulfide:quinone oxidoreductase, mitochondrial [Aphelenchoides bicaudatus]|nr:Sulfide:quinone oxidoreductase, mitochondrial [Aphelenchoides bicaudatus]